MKPFKIFITTLCLGLLLAGCELIPSSGENLRNPPTQPTRDPNEPTVSVLPEDFQETEPDNHEDVEQLTMVVTEKTIKELDSYPNLKALDLSGSTCYTAIMVYIQNHPEVEVTYTVEFGSTYAMNWTDVLTLPAHTTTFADLQKNLVYLPLLKTLRLPKTNLAASEITMLRNAYPEIDISYTANICGMEFPEDTEEMNLSGMTSEDIASAAIGLSQLPNLHYVELMNSSGTCSLSKQEVKLLAETIPDVRFHYVFNLFGQTVSTTDSTITFTKLSLTDAAEGEIREAMSLMAPGSTLILDQCGLSYELLDSIRADYDDVDLVWRVSFGTYNRYDCLTNKETIRAVYNVTDDTCEPLKYCRSAKYIDMGHNDTLTDVSFIGYMPNLEILILSGSMIEDLSGFENCKKLEFLELANCLKLSDLTPLSGCAGLKYLNICYTKVSNLLPLDGLPLEALFCKQTRVNAEEQKLFKEVHPECNAVFTGKDPYAGPGWRYTDYGYTYTSFYKRVREVFNLDSVDQRLRAMEAAK